MSLSDVELRKSAIRKKVYEILDSRGYDAGSIGDRKRIVVAAYMDAVTLGFDLEDTFGIEMAIEDGEDFIRENSSGWRRFWPQHYIDVSSVTDFLSKRTDLKFERV